MVNDVTHSPEDVRGESSLSINLTPLETVHASTLIEFLSRMVVAMGLPQTIFETKANGLFLLVNEASGSRISAEILLRRNSSEHPLLVLVWEPTGSMYRVFSDLDSPIAPMSNMLMTIPPDQFGYHAVTEEQAMKVLYTMLRYLEVENRSSTGGRTGLPKNAVVTA